MPRTEFKSVNELDFEDFVNKWVKGVRKGSYVSFYTDNSELILVPTTSTSPTLYGYVKPVSRIDALAICDRHGISYIECASWVWDSEHTPKES